MNNLDWNLLRTFAAVAEHGSSSAAASTLGLAQPTAARHIAQLETQLGVTLFARHARGMSLTTHGEALYEHAALVRSHIHDLERCAAGLDPGVDGTVRISASEVAALYLLPTLLASIRAEHPRIEFEVVADNRSANLGRRDADIALRMYRPTHPELITRHVADTHLGLWAHERYLARWGAPTTISELPDHTVLGFDKETLHIRALAKQGVTVRKQDFAVRCDAQPFHVRAVVDGLGIAAMQDCVARKFEGLQRVMPQLELDPLPVWLVAHKELRRSPRVKLVWDALLEGLREVIDRQRPERE